MGTNFVNDLRNYEELGNDTKLEILSKT